MVVSIHATLAGGDRAYKQPANRHNSFYPRHPRGWRPWKAPLWTATATGFYPRHPRGWRRSSYIFRTPRRSVSIHATLAGGDALNTVGPVCQLVSIHATLAGGDASAVCAGNRRVGVSIHATLAGGDGLSPHLPHHRAVFLSTPPSRVATQSPRRPHRPKHVSIHATLAGGDRCLPYGLQALSSVSIHATLAGGDLGILIILMFLFVSIHATLAGGDVKVVGDFTRENGFYPRHPRGWRPRPARASF